MVKRALGPAARAMDNSGQHAHPRRSRAAPVVTPAAFDVVGIGANSIDFVCRLPVTDPSGLAAAFV